MPLSSPLVFDTIFRNAESTALLVFDPSGKIKDFNIGFQKLLGYSKDSLLGKNISELYIKEDVKGNISGKVIEQALKTGSSHDDNYLKHEDGSLIWVHGECILGKDENGRQYIVKIIQNLNKARLLEQKLIDINEEQEKIIKDHETFVYTTSHDLRSPINNLDALVQNVDESYNDPKLIKSLAPLMKDSIVRLRNKIGELSAIGKMNEEENKKSSVSFHSIYDEVLLDLKKEIDTSNAEISSDFSQVPTIQSSKKNIRSILQNLLSNSIKYRSLDKKPIISVKTKYAEDLVLLEVRDNGLGIRDEEKAKVFNMYHRLHKHIEGTGVGLGIVKKIVKNEGGKIELESQAGKGSLFKIYLKE